MSIITVKDTIKLFMYWLSHKNTVHSTDNNWYKSW
jgi:hypothetical protein